MKLKMKQFYSIPKLGFIISFCIITSSLYGQIDYDIWERNAITKDVISPPPTPSELGKYVEIPVSTYTGLPNIDIPIYNIQEKGYSLPVSLSYHASGIKVQQRASWVGLGWSLNAGGVITRVVRGIPDDQDSITTNLGKSGKLFSDYQFYSEEYGDNESDLYYFNFNGHSGKFFFDSANNAVYSGQEQPFKITYETDSLEYFGVMEFTIVTNDGTKYIFRDLEIVTDIPTEPDTWDEPLYVASYLTDDWHTTPQVPWNPLVEEEERRWYRYISSWYLSKIDLPNSGDEITFNYYQRKYNYVEKTGEQRRYGLGAFLECEVVNSPEPSVNLFYTYKASLIDGVQLKEISWNSGSLSFVPSHPDSVRKDVYDSDFYDEIWLNSDCASYDDYENYYGSEKYLDKIFLHDNSGDSIIEYDLQYDYFTSDGYTNAAPKWKHLYKRLKLEGIQEKTVSGLAKPLHTFTYSTEELPQRYDPQVDFWGYYNANGDTTLIPKIWAYQDIADSVENTLFQSIYCPIPMSGYGTADIFDGAIRTADSTVNQACMLKKITYPTGGYDEFTYETNLFKLGDSTYLGGGLRIKRIETKESASNTAKKREYTYLDDQGLCSGRITGFPLFVSLNHRYNFNPDGYNDSFMYRHHSSSLSDLGSTKGSIVGYENVTIDYDNNGKEKYCFDLPGTLEEKYACILLESGDTVYQKQEKRIRWGYLHTIYFTDEYKDGYPYYPEPDFDWARGQLLKKEVYNEDGDLLKQIENKYSIQNYSKHLMKWKGQKIYFSYEISEFDCNESVPHWGEYSMLSGWKALDTSIVKTYDPDISTKYVLETTFYDYNDSLQLLKTQCVLDSNGDTLKTIYRYTVDETTSPYTTMVDSFNMLSYPTKISQYKESTFLSSKSTTYKDWGTNTFAPEYIKQKVGTSEYNQVQYLAYDDHLNPLSASKTNDIKQSLIWGYNKTLPIAAITNASEKEVYHENFEDTCYSLNNSHTGSYHTQLSNDDYCGVADFSMSDLVSGKYIYSAWIKTTGDASLIVKDYQDQNPWIRVLSGNTYGEWKYIEVEVDVTSAEFSGCQTVRCEIWNNDTSPVYVDDVIFRPSDALMTTYTYKPLVGMTSQTDPNGQTIFYEYDDLGRLTQIKDCNNRLIQKTEYHYANQ